MPPDLRWRWQAYLEREGDPEELAEQHLSQFVFAPNKADQDQKQSLLQWWTEVFRDRDITKLEDQLYPGDETPSARNFLGIDVLSTRAQVSRHNVGWTFLSVVRQMTDRNVHPTTPDPSQNL